MIRSALAALIVLPLISGCTMLEPEPCTQEWFDWKTERIVGQFARNHRKQIDDFRKVAPTMFGAEGGLGEIAPSSLLILTAVGALQLGADFGKEAWPEVSSAIGQCATGPRAEKLFVDMLRREGIDERAVKAVETLVTIVDK